MNPSSVYHQGMGSECISIRLATESDLRAVQLCARAAFSRYIERMGKEPAPITADFENQIDLGQVHIALCGNSFVGYVVFYPRQDHMHLESVAVDPSHSGKGIGRKLVEYVEQAARNDGFHAVELYTNEAMTENLSIYPYLGYVEIGRKQQAGFNRVFFRKTI